MPEETLRLDIPVLLPEIPDARDACVARLESQLRSQSGIYEAHVVDGGDPAHLCIHFDPNLVSLAAVRRSAQEAGAALTARYRHEQIPFAGMDAADAAPGLAAALEALPGMLHAAVSYAAGLVFVAYDTERLDRDAIAAAIRRMGYRVVPQVPPRAAIAPPAPPAEEPDHGAAPGFLPRWMRERWELLLVALAGLFFFTGWLGAILFDLPDNIALIFYLLAYAAGGWDLAYHAFPGLLRGRFDTDLLMIAAALGAAVLGEWAEGAFLLFLFSLAHAGEHYVLDRTRNAVNALGELMPATAQRKMDGQLVETPVEQLAVGDVVVVRPGDRVPVDGTVVSGASSVDQSPITGESVPVAKESGDELFAGTINQEAALDVRVTRLAQDNTLSRVMQMVAEAQSQQSPTQQLTQRFTRWFVPGVLIAAFLLAAVPPLFGWLTFSQSFYRAMLLLVAASPCALAVGTPAAVLAGIAQAARNGVLIKGGVHLENLGSLEVIAFDKTGTLTTGDFAVADVVPYDGNSEETLLQVAAAIEQQSNHPLALAVTRAARDAGLELPAPGTLENVPGRGVRSAIDGDPVLIGNLELFEETPGHPLPHEIATLIARLEAEGKTTMAVSRNGEFLGVLALADQPRPGVAATLRHLLSLGISHLVMLTGDNEQVARQIAQEVAVTDVRADLLPADKLDAIRALQEQFGAVAMTGDGVNDAPALATATVGIAMGGAGTAVALETADVALMADDIGRLPFAVGLSRASRAIIQQNLVISLGIIGLLLVTSVAGLVELSGAVFIHEGSTIIVVVNALRLLGYRGPTLIEGDGS
ncbi:MAG: heavy metal translocating P-type ATPase [Anaerolineae bacterium]|nr:heavy metal translocating P-type ATPase [Anaerolineae bacterium]